MRFELIAGYIVTLGNRPADRHNYPAIARGEDRALYVWWISAALHIARFHVRYPAMRRILRKRLKIIPLSRLERDGPA